MSGVVIGGVVGVTGCVGAGKSHVCATLAASRGWSVLEVDDVVREVLQALGVDTRAIFAGVMQDPATRASWTERVRPAVLERIDAWIGRLEGVGLLESALLFEEGLAARCAVTICVTCDPVERRRRVERRATSSAGCFDTIERAQWTEEEKAARADLCVAGGELDVASTLTGIDRARLGGTWASLLTRSGATREVEHHYAELVARYAEPQRAYHTLAHVAACLDALDAAVCASSERDLVALALFYHDAIYDPRAGDNEARSAALAETALRTMGVSESLSRRVHALVLTTKTHAPDGDPIAALLVDVDLAILGAEPRAYRAYQEGIRREHAHVPGCLFAWGRRRVLRGFLARPAIYQTARFRGRLEAAARANLADELAHGATTSSSTTARVPLRAPSRASTGIE